jgi:ABC-type antimicrobial peptide transport system permease subunit
MSYSAAMGTTGQLDPGTSGGAGGAGLSLGTGTGQQGTQTVDTADQNPVVAVWTWLNTPFTSPMSPWSVALLVGIVLVAIIGWNLILYHIRIAAESL